MIFISTLILLAYILLISSFIYGFNQVKPFNKLDSKPINTFSIIVPFRNEADNLPELLQSLTSLNYPRKLFEIILIDDDSTDDGVAIINGLKNQHPKISIIVYTNLIKSNSPKKDAIELAIKESKNDWIATTDADCILPTNWLLAFDNFIQKKDPKMICAPVTYKSTASFLDTFQLLDFTSLIGATIGAFGIKKPFLCNGANICYSKESFLKVNGFEGNNHLSSGDDVFLLEKFYAEFPEDIHFIKSIDTIVETKPENSFKKLFYQRLRWASKSSKSSNKFTLITGIIVFIMNTILLILFIISIFSPNNWLLIAYIFSIKFLVDLLLISKTLLFFNQKKTIFYFPLASIFYPFFSTSVVITSFFNIKNTWKSRKINS